MEETLLKEELQERWGEKPILLTNLRLHNLLVEKQ